MKRPENILIYVGINNKTMPKDYEKDHNVHTIGEIRKHPGYEDYFPSNDVAILNLIKPINLVEGQTTKIPMMEPSYTLSKWILISITNKFNFKVLGYAPNIILNILSWWCKTLSISWLGFNV